MVHLSLHRTLSLFLTAIAVVAAAPKVLISQSSSQKLTLHERAHVTSPSEQSRDFLGVRVDDVRNRVVLEVPAAMVGRDFLYQNTLATGFGVSGGPGLDRGQLGQSVVVRLERRGSRLHLVRDNWSVRATTATEAGQRAATEAFPRSIIASFAIEAERDGHLTADATSFFLSDTYGIASSLRGGQGGGNYRIDVGRSWADTARTKSFPRNTEVHAVLTFVSDAPSQIARRAAPDASTMTFELHHSLVALPSSDGYRPRAFDPRAGYFATQFSDFSQSFDQLYRSGFINRWRLIPRDTTAYMRGELVEPVEPITYYLDPAIPAPYREAFREGGNWWSRVFEAAGFRNAFRVLDLPEGVDPMDSRFNVLYWIHRSAPGPSVGPSYSDPRTGEIVRTVIRMDSWRSQIDFNIYAGLLPAAGSKGLDLSAEEFTMARRRQHTAHEIGHTLGLQHNFIAASQNRSSVMDYPVPLIHMRADGSIDISDAYRTGPGAWDSLAIRYGYTWFPDSVSERIGLARILEEGVKNNVRFVNDQYAGPDGSIPAVTRWVEGATMFDAVERTSTLRRHLIRHFDERAIKPGEPMHLLNMRFAHVYLHHRYSLEGLIKTIGGTDFTFAMRGDAQTPVRAIPKAEQELALKLILDALQPSELVVPERVVALIPPAPPGFNSELSWIRSSGTTVFDAVSLAGGLATEVVAGLLDRSRTARMILLQSGYGSNTLSLDQLLTSLVQRTWGVAYAESASQRSVLRATQRVVVDELLDLAGDSRALPDVRASAHAHVVQLDALLNKLIATTASAEERAHIALARHDIARYLAGQDTPSQRPRYQVVTLPWP